MTFKNLFLLTLLLVSAGCVPARNGGDYDAPPCAFTVVEESPAGLFVRLASPERLSRAQLLDAVASFSPRFDRIDFCLADSTARGQEYITVMCGVVFDHDADQCYSITSSDYDTK